MLIPVVALAAGLLTGPVPPELDAWAPLLAFGEPPAATARLKGWTRLARAWNEAWVLDTEARRRYASASEHLDLLDLAELHRMMPRTSTTTLRRGWTFHGRLTDSGRLEVLSQAPRGPPRFGDGRVDLGLTPLPPDAFTIDTQAVLRPEVGAHELLEVVRRTFGWLAARARAVPPSKPRTFDAADAAVLHALRRAYPRSSEFVLRYLFVEDILEPARGGARLRLVIRLNLGALEQDCPDLARSVGRAADLFTARARMHGPAHDIVGVGQIHGPDRRARLSFVLEPHRWFRPSYETHADLVLDTFGTHIEALGLDVRTALTSKPDHLVVTSQLHGEPRLTIETPAIVDAFIPSDLDTIIRRFFELLAPGPDRAGAHMQTSLPNRKDEPAQVYGAMAIPDNGTVTFGLRIIRALGWSDAQQTQRRWLLARGLDAFEADLKRLEWVNAERD